MSLSDVAKSGDYKKSLEALRDRLAEEIETTTSGRDLAALSRQFHAVLDALAADEAPDEESPAERIRRASEARKAAQEAGTE